MLNRLWNNHTRVTELGVRFFREGSKKIGRRDWKQPALLIETWKLVPSLAAPLALWEGLKWLIILLKFVWAYLVCNYLICHLDWAFHRCTYLLSLGQQIYSPAVDRLWKLTISAWIWINSQCNMRYEICIRLRKLYHQVVYIE